MERNAFDTALSKLKNGERIPVISIEKNNTWNRFEEEDLSKRLMGFKNISFMNPGSLMVVINKDTYIEKFLAHPVFCSVGVCLVIEDTLGVVDLGAELFVENECEED